MTERGREVARLTPSTPPESPIARLVAERGATMPAGTLRDYMPPRGRRPDGPVIERLLEEQREERL